MNATMTIYKMFIRVAKVWTFAGAVQLTNAMVFFYVRHNFLYLITAGQHGSVIVEHVLEGKGRFGYNAATKVYEDMVKAGVIDATKVVRCALENASSVATLLLTSAAVIAEASNKEEADG